VNGGPEDGGRPPEEPERNLLLTALTTEHFHLRLAGVEARYFLLGAHDDVYGVPANMGIGTPSRWQLYVTLASMIAVLNSVVGAATLALAARLLAASIAISVLVGGAALLVSVAFHIVVQRRTHVSARSGASPLLPTIPRDEPSTPEART
jgi:hypothetical protein